VAVSHTPQGVLLLDPDESEESSAAAVVTLAYPHHHDLPPAPSGGGSTSTSSSAPPGGQQLALGPGLLACHTAGRCSLQQYSASLEAGAAACRALAGFMHQSLASQAGVR
jgi:hypothetical protein